MVRVKIVPGYTRVMPGWDPERFVSNGLARLLIWINLRGVKLRIGLGRGVRYYNELEIWVKVGVGGRGKVRVRVKVRGKGRGKYDC